MNVCQLLYKNSQIVLILIVISVKTSQFVFNVIHNIICLTIHAIIVQ